MQIGWKVLDAAAVLVYYCGGADGDRPRMMKRNPMTNHQAFVNRARPLRSTGSPPVTGSYLSGRALCMRGYAMTRNELRTLWERLVARDGAECPTCGSQMTEYLGRGRWICWQCRRQFREGDDGGRVMVPETLEEARDGNAT